MCILGGGGVIFDFEKWLAVEIVSLSFVRIWHHQNLFKNTGVDNYIFRSKQMAFSQRVFKRKRFILSFVNKIQPHKDDTQMKKYEQKLKRLKHTAFSNTFKRFTVQSQEQRAKYDPTYSKYFTMN